MSSHALPADSLRSSDLRATYYHAMEDQCQGTVELRVDGRQLAPSDDARCAVLDLVAPMYGLSNRDETDGVAMRHIPVRAARDNSVGSSAAL